MLDMASWEEFYSSNKIVLPDLNTILTDCSTYCLILRSLEGFKSSLLPSLPTDTPTNNLSYRLALRSKQSDNFKLDGFTIKIHLFDFENKKFLGRTWVSPPFKISQEEKKSFCSLGHTLYFQLPNSFYTYFVVEFVTKAGKSDSTIFWTSFDPFAHLQNVSDLSTPTKHPQLRIPLFYGSPRSLFFLKSTLLDSKSPTPVPGCLLICSLTTHKALQCTSHLFPPFYLLSSSSIIPGLVYSSRQPFKDPFSSPKLLDTLPCHISELSVEFSQDFSSITEDLLTTIKSSSQIPVPGDARISEIRLRVGIHNGLTFIHQPKILYLERDRHSDQSLRAIGSFQLEDLIQHPLMSLIFQIDIQIHVRNVTSTQYPLLSKGNLKALSQKDSRVDPFQYNVSLSWGAWCPFSGVAPPPEDPVCVGFRLRTGPGISPYNVPVLRGGKHTSHIRFYFTHWSEQAEEGARLKRSISSTSVPISSHRGQIPRRSHSQIGAKYSRKKTRPFSPPSSATPPLAYTNRASSLGTFESVLNDSNINGGSVPHLDRIHDSPSAAILSTKQHSNSSLTYSNLSRVHNVKSTSSTPVNTIKPPINQTYIAQANELAMTSSDNKPQLQEEIEAPILGDIDITASPGRIITRDHTSFIQVPHSQTPAHIPVPYGHTLQGVDTKQGLSRADYALLHNSGFQEVLSNKGNLADSNTYHTSQSYPSRACLSVQLMAFQLPLNPIENILEGYSSLAMFDAPKQVFCTYKLFKWQPNTTPKLSLVRKEIRPSDKRITPYLLMEEATSSPGYLSGYQITCQSHVRELISYLHTYKIQFDLWDGESLMLIGSGFISLKQLVSNHMESVQMIKELELSSLDVFNSNDILVLDQNGQFCHSQGRTVPQGTLVIRYSYMPDFSDSYVCNFEHFYSLDRTDYNSILNGVKVKQQSVRQAKRVSKAKHMTETDDSLRSMLHSTADANRPTGKENTRKLERMRMVRGASGHTPNISEVSQIKRRKDFQILDMYRKDSKFQKIDSLLTEFICSEISIDAAAGIAYYYEHELKNPFSETLVLNIEIPDSSISLVSNSNELRYLKSIYNSLTPVENDLIHFSDQKNEPQIFLQPKESVIVPFKYQSFRIHSLSNESKHLEMFKIQIRFLTEENRAISVLTFNINPQPVLTDYTMHFYHPERIFFRKTFLLPSTMFSRSTADNFDEVSALCSDKNVFAVFTRNEVGDSLQLHVKVACENQINQYTFFLMIYNDKYLSKPTQTWEICIHPLARIDMNCTIGQSCFAKVYIKGTAYTRVVQCYSSHPHVVQIQPKEKFVLTANSMMEINLGVKPTFIGNRNMCVNVVDREMSQIIQQWMICINSKEPNISRSYRITIPTHDSVITTKRITFRNPYSKRKEFFLHCSRADILTFKENSFQVNGLTTHTIFLNFQPVSYSLELDILIFINDKQDNTEECFCIQISYENV
ncbi:Nephrocystin-4 [Oopsacas minuta]|uniref:Nephrocystin-4 n=1 Tax=Oopsacas minuta TaxID=111878 RepID=A0AAV7K5F8_9METZ|nr:Nephrocystin-4 [Oopsacas minuta]